MNGLRPSRLIIEGFRSYKERSEIIFPSGGSVIITGADDSTGISSGSGKTSIVEAIAFALGFGSLPQTELKNWYSKKMFVSLLLTDGENSYEIIRDPKLSLIKNGIQYDGTSSGAESELALILKCSPEIAKALTYRAQLEPGRFINSTDSKNKDFLSNCIIGLDEIDRLSDVFETEKNSLEREIGNASIEIDTLSKVLSGMSIDLDSLRKSKDMLDRVKEAMLTSQDSEIENLRASARKIQEHIDQISNIHMKSSFAVKENESIKEIVPKLKAEIEYLHASTCPTCKQQWKDPSLKNKEEELSSKFQSLMEKFQVNSQYCKNSQLTIDSLPQVKNEYQEIQNKIASALAPQQSLSREHSVAQAAYDDKVRNYRAISDSKERLDREITKRNEKEASANIYNHLSSIFSRSGFLGSIFEEIVKEIELRTNDMVAMMPNVSRFTVQISTEVEQKNGKSKKSITTKLLKDGKEVTVKNLSGGQRRSLELCTDLAVSETIRSRSGSSLNWIILDEALDNLDVEPKKYAIEMIKQKVQGLVVVIDHSTEIKEMFDSIISVKYNGRDSSVT